MRNRQRPLGFTLIELLLVLAIISLVVGFITVNLTTVRAKSRDNQRQLDAASLATALELYRTQEKKYPVPTGANSGLVDSQGLEPFLVPSYLSSFPKDPFYPSPYSFDRGGITYATNPAQVSGQPRTTGSLFVIDVRLERDDVAEDLSPSLAGSATNNSQIGFYQGGFYRVSAASPVHFRIASR